MLEKPELPDEVVVRCLQDAYGIDASALEFLPVGNDSSAWSYSFYSDERYYLKIRREPATTHPLAVARYLEGRGVREAVAPLLTKDGRLMHGVGAFSLALYPFVEGRVAMAVGLSARQRVELGKVLKRMHTIPIEPDLASIARTETFVPKWGRLVKSLDLELCDRPHADPVTQDLASDWCDRQEEICSIVERTEYLGSRLERYSPVGVLCHGDIHTANILIDNNGGLRIVDWDETVIAPKERDLMFVLDDDNAYQGYGPTDIDPVALAYYCYEWVVQELGDYGERIVCLPGLSDMARLDALRQFRDLFQPGDVVDTAYSAGEKFFA
jgi:spectinomycin phosphotransferase